MVTTLNHASFFSGIGGFDYAAEKSGWKNIFHCEIDPFCQRVLKYHFPNSIPYADIRETCFQQFRGLVDVLTGGFPCQPFSQAGKKLGKADDRHLWPEMLRGILEIRPRWILGENVRGIANWNGGLVFEEVQSDLASAGYETIPFRIPACGINAPHRRERIWFLAHASSIGVSGHRDELEVAGSCRQWWENNEEVGHLAFTPANASRTRFWLQEHGSRISEQSDETGETDYWENWPSQSPICGRNDGLPRELDGIAFSKWKSESIKAYGNAIVPQLAMKFFKAINQYEALQ